MSTYKEPTPEQIARYRDLQLEDPPGGSDEEHMRWYRDLVRRMAEALDVPEHVIEAEHEAERRDKEAFDAARARERAANPKTRIRGTFEHYALRRYIRPIPRWCPEDDKQGGEGQAK